MGAIKFLNKQEIHIKRVDLKTALESIRVNLQWYIGGYDASLFKRLKGTGCSSGFMMLIEELVKGTLIDDSFITKHLQMGEIVDAIALDQKHDFHDKRCNLGDIVNFTTTPIDNMTKVINEVLDDASNGVKALKGDDELLPEKYSIDMGPQSQYAKSIRKAIDDLESNVYTGGGRINTISQVIDAAGCDTSCNSDTISNTIDINLQFYIYNIGYLFFQGFFKFFIDDYKLPSGNICKYRVLFGNGPVPPRGDDATKIPFTPLKNTSYPSGPEADPSKIKCDLPQDSTGDELTLLKGNIYLFVYKNNTMIARNKINVGSSGFSVKKICEFIKGDGENDLFTKDFVAKIKSSIGGCGGNVKDIEDRISRFFVSLPMSIKCFGDSGQMVLSLVMSCSSTLCKGDYANKYILITCDTFFFQLLHLFKCPFILGTRSTPCYLYDESSKLKGKLAINIYSNASGNIKIANNNAEAVYEGIKDEDKKKLNVYGLISIRDCTTYYSQIMKAITTAVRNNNRLAIDTVCNKYVIVPYGDVGSPHQQSYCLVEREHFNGSDIKAIGKGDTIERFHIIVEGVDSLLVYNGTGDAINASKNIFDKSLQTITRVTKLKTFIETIVEKLKYYDDITYARKNGNIPKKEGNNSILFFRQFHNFTSKFSLSSLNQYRASKGNHLDNLAELSRLMLKDDDLLLLNITGSKDVKGSKGKDVKGSKGSKGSKDAYVIDEKAFKQILEDLNVVFKMNGWYKEFKLYQNGSATGLKPCGLTKDAFEECFDMCDCYVLELEAVNKHLETIYDILVQERIQQNVKDELCDDAVKLINYFTKIELLSKSSTEQLQQVISYVSMTIDTLLPLFKRLKGLQETYPESPLVKRLNEESYELFDKSISTCIEDYIYFAEFIKKVEGKISKHNAVIELSSPSFLMSYSFISLFKKLLPQRETPDDKTLQEYKSAIDILLVSLNKRIEAKDNSSILSAMKVEEKQLGVINAFKASMRPSKRQKTSASRWNILKEKLAEVSKKLQTNEVKQVRDIIDISGLEELEDLFANISIQDINDENDESLLKAKDVNNELGDKIFLDDGYDCDDSKDCEKECDDVCDVPSSSAKAVSKPVAKAVSKPVAKPVPKAYATAPKAVATAPKAYATSPKAVATAPKAYATAPKAVATAPKAYATADFMGISPKDKKRKVSSNASNASNASNGSNGSNGSDGSDGSDGSNGSNAASPVKPASPVKRPKKTLEEEIEINETAKVHIIGLTLETRPDTITIEEIANFRRYNCTRIQLGVQHTNNAVLKKIMRGHTIERAYDAIKMLKNNCYKVDIHIMPNLPGASFEIDKAMLEEVLYDERIQADQYKIYPTAIVPYTRIKRWFEEGSYVPYDDLLLYELIKEFKQKVQKYKRLNRIIRDIPGHYIEGGYSTKFVNMRQLLQDDMRANHWGCKCIRCREVKGNQVPPDNIKLNIEKYRASGGDEYHISFDTDCEKNYLIGFLRLRLAEENAEEDAMILPSIKGCALIRELHVYSNLNDVGNSIEGSLQHKGYGRQLVAKAEEVAKENGYRKVAIISGTGVRGYYKKLGYQLIDTYMIKDI